MQEVPILTVGFTVHFTAPVQDGELQARGRLVHEARRLYVAAAELYDQAGRLLGTGSGTFTRSKIPLTPAIGYADHEPA